MAACTEVHNRLLFISCSFSTQIKVASICRCFYANSSARTAVLLVRTDFEPDVRFFLACISLVDTSQAARRDSHKIHICHTVSTCER